MSNCNNNFHCADIKCRKMLQSDKSANKKTLSDSSYGKKCVCKVVDQKFHVIQLLSPSDVRHSFGPASYLTRRPLQVKSGPYMDRHWILSDRSAPTYIHNNPRPRRISGSSNEVLSCNKEGGSIV